LCCGFKIAALSLFFFGGLSGGDITPYKMLVATKTPIFVATSNVLQPTIPSNVTTVFEIKNHSAG